MATSTNPTFYTEYKEVEISANIMYKSSLKVRQKSPLYFVTKCFHTSVLSENEVQLQ